MDLSSSMIDDKQNVEKLGVTLAATMRNITSNFKLGFGSFVDKNAIPFVGYTGDYCYNDNGVVVCQMTYSFKHRLKLNQNEDTFVVKHQIKFFKKSGGLVSSFNI